MKYLILLIAPLLCMGAASVNNTNVVPNLSVLTNAYVGGFASLSGQTNRLTVVSGKLNLDGTPIVSDTTWTNVAGALKPALGQTTNLLHFTSGMADNATNAALFVDTASTWTPGAYFTDGAHLAYFRNNSTNVFSITSAGGLALGRGVDTMYAQSVDPLFMVGWKVTSLGDGPDTGFYFESADNVDGDNLGYLSSLIGTNYTSFTVGVEPGDKVVINNLTDSEFTCSLVGSMGMSEKWWIRPAKAPGLGVPLFYFASENAQTAGDVLFAVANVTTNKMVLSANGNLTLAGGIVGTTTNDDAPTGDVGQIISSAVAAGSAVSLTTATPANITSISLTAGDWDVEGNINFTRTGATITATAGGIGTTTATLPTDGTQVHTGTLTTTANLTDGLTLPRKRISISGTTTVYLVASTSFSAGTSAGFGSISARRVR